MKSLSLKFAVASALSLAGFSAMASGLAPTAITGATIVHIGGATATNNALGNIMKIAVGGVCQAGTLSVFTSASTANVLYLCTSNAIAAANGNPAIAAGTTIAVVKESNGGSANGVHNPADPTATLTFLNTTAANLGAPNCTAGADTAAVGDFALFTPYTCTTATASAVHPDVGVSDVDPGTFSGISTVTSADVAKYNAPGSAVSAIGVPFNPIVSTSLFLALQKAQGLTTTTEDLSSVAKMPTLTSAQLRAVFSGQALLASQLYSNGVQLSTLGGADGLVHLCRRGNTSGTMTSFKLHFLGEGCTKNPSSVTVFNVPENSDEAAGTLWSDATNGGDLVFAGAGSGDVRSCVNFHSQNGNYAIGTVSVEARPAVSGTTNLFRYVKVDSAEPTLKSVMEGRYDFFTENTFNTPAAAVGTPQASIFGKIASLIVVPSVIAKVNEAWQNSGALGQGTALNSGDGTGDVGILAIPTSTSNPTFPIVGTGANSVRTKPINSQRRNAPGAGANNCNRPYQAFPSL